MRHRLVTATAVVALAAAPSAFGAGPNLGTTTTLNTPTVSYQTAPAGSATALQARAADGHVLREASVPGAWGIPVVTINGDGGGLSRDGRVLVLAETNNVGRPLRARSRFVVLDARTLAAARTIGLRGDFGFDALSPNGRTLFLIEHHAASNLSRYRVRAYDLKTGRLLPGAIVDKRDVEPMSGFPAARVSTADGRHVFTLYASEEHPFVHALDTVSRTAVCIDLPPTLIQVEQATMRLTSGKLTINGAGTDGPRFVVDTRTFRVS